MCIALNSPCMMYERSYCGRMLQWHILQDPCDPFKAPDVVFDDSTFSPLTAETSNSDLEQLLDAWDGSQRAASLDKLLQLLVQLYMQHQKAKIAAMKDERLLFELAMLEELGCTEVLLTDAAGGTQQACFLIPVNADLASVQRLIGMLQQQPMAQQQQQQGSAGTQHAASSSDSSSSNAPPQQQQFMLHVAFRLDRSVGSNHAAPEVQLQQPQWFTDYLQPLSLPTWVPQSSLLEYVPHVTEQLSRHLQETCPAVLLRFDFVNALSAAFGAPVEVNMQSRSGISSGTSSSASSSGRNQYSSSAGFHVLLEGQPLLVHITMSPAFPGEAPSVVLQSIRRPGADSIVTLQNIPWSPRWPADEMAARLFNCVKQKAPNAVPRDTAAVPGGSGVLLL